MRPVQIGIVVFNSRGDLPRCFEGIRRQTYPNLRITVLDNASTDGSVEWLRQCAPDAQVILNEQNVGFGHGHNAIMTERRAGEYYMALNPDVVLLPDYISRLVAALEANPKAGWGTGILLLPDGRHIYSAGHALTRSGYAFNIGYGMLPDASFAQSREVFGAPGAAVILKDTLIDALAPAFDEHIFLYGEDTDLDWRARRMGWSCIYAAEAQALHRGSDPGEARRAEAVANRTLSVLKNATLTDLVFYNLPAMVGHLLFRCVATPRLGLHMVRLIAASAPAMLRQRKRAVVPRREMLRWFDWSWEQPTTQPRSLGGRLKSFRDYRRKARQFSRA